MMADLVLKGMLNLTGNLKLVGKVKVGAVEALVEVSKGDPASAQGKGAPVILPPPPAPPTDPGIDAWVFKSFNATVTANDIAIVTQGMMAQGNPGMATWPGMVQRSISNPGVTINNLPINVVGDLGITLPNGAPVTFTASGQM
jgi:hypothetical protein